VADVFLSYKREDRARAKTIADAVEQHGYSVFFDAEIDVGESFDERIEREINEAKCVVVLWSERSAIAKWVRREARVGSERGQLVPAIIGECKIPLEFSDIQAADLRAWRGDPAAPEWVQFIARITDLLKTPARALPAKPWRRRWVRASIAAIAGIGVIAALVFAVPWRDLHDQDPAVITTQPQAGAPDSAAATVPGANPASSASVPTEIWQALNWSVLAGDCQGLVSDIGALKVSYPGISSLEGAMTRECRRNEGRLAAAAPTPTTSTQTGSAAPSAPGAGSAPTSSAPAAPEPQSPRENFLASLVAQDRAPLTRANFERIAAQLGVEWQALAAVAEAESSALGGFAADGRLNISFERNLFSRKTNGVYDQSHPAISNRTPGGHLRTQAQRWEQLEAAYALDPEAALQSTSWGRFTILGQNYAVQGFADAHAFVASMARSEVGQLAAFAAFVRVNGIADELQRRDWVGFARRYNGPQYATQQYDSRIAAAYARLSESETP